MRLGLLPDVVNTLQSTSLSEATTAELHSRKLSNLASYQLKFHKILSRRAPDMY